MLVADHAVVVLDHLSGVLFVDRLSFAKRALIKGKLKELAGGKEK